jgi:hypothetical protein
MCAEIHLWVLKIHVMKIHYSTREFNSIARFLFMFHIQNKAQGHETLGVRTAVEENQSGTSASRRHD